MCRQMGLRYEVPDDVHQKMLSDIIYGSIKKGQRVDMEKFGEICEALRKKGCENLVLGCTELSLIKRDFALGDEYVDSLEVLAMRTIRLCGKTPVGFGVSLMNDTEE